MEYRWFGRTDLKVSEIGFGAWAIGGNARIGKVAIGWGPTNDEDSRKAIHAALERGINFFDTADIYGLGHSEQLLGEELAGRKDIILATKVGNCSRDGAFMVDYSYDYIIQACEKSLHRLRRDVIDYYQLHTARVSHLEQGDCIAAMHDLQAAGKIKHWGISLNTFEPEPEGEWILNHYEGAGFQIVLNLLNSKAIPLMLQAASQGYGLIARMPLQFGLLTGNMTDERRFGLDDHRHGRLDPEFRRTVLNHLNEHIWPLCQAYRCTPLQLALSYILAYQEINTVIPGMRTTAQVFDNTSALPPMDKKDRDFLEQLFLSAAGQAVWRDLILRG